MDITLPVADLAAAMHQHDARLPFPFTDHEQSSDDDAPPVPPVAVELVPALTALARPRQILYAVTVASDGDASRTAAVEGSGGSGCFVLTVDDATARVVERGPLELVRSVVDVIAATGDLDADPLFDRELTVPKEALSSEDSEVTADRLRAADVHERQVSAWLLAGRPRRSGLLGAIDFGDATSRHVQRGVAWRVHAGGSVLLVETSPRGRRPAAFALQPLTHRTLTRAALDLMSSLNLHVGSESGTMRASHR